MKRVVGVITFFIGVIGGYAQQDAQYSQYMFNQLALNPAYAGSREVLATSLVYRDQWTGIDGAPKTAGLSVQAPLRKKKIGLGAEILSDKLGPKKSTAILFSYAYRIPFSKGKLAFGLRMGMYNYVYDWSAMDYRDKSDAYNTGTRDSKITGTGDFGTYYYSRTFYWGLGMTHLNRGKVTSFNSDSSRQAFHFFMPIGKAFEVGNVVLNPSILLKGATNAPAEMDINFNVLMKDKWWLGVSFRSKYGVIFLTQYQITEHFKAGYSYDYGMNKIGRIGGGTHEIMIGYDINIHGTKMIMPRFM